MRDNTDFDIRPQRQFFHAHHFSCRKRFLEISDINFIYFFASGYLAVTLTASILLYFIRFLLEAEPRKRPVGFDETREARRVFRTYLRRGAIFATAILSLGLLKTYDLDNLLNSVFIILIALLIEVYFSSR